MAEHIRTIALLLVQAQNFVCVIVYALVSRQSVTLVLAPKE